jgi:arylsulfatase A-like enzyme
MPPNLLLIVVDCLRADFVYEQGHAELPTLRRLLSEGTRFKNVITSMDFTTAAFASILTGEYPVRHGIWTMSRHRLNPEVRTLPETLAAAGYTSYAEVSGPLRTEQGYDRGFNHYSLRGKDETIHTPWGDRLIREIVPSWRAPWFGMLHIWSLHEPRIVIPECRDPRFGRTLYGRALSSIDRYLERLIAALPLETVVVLTGDHGEMIPRNALDLLYKRARRRLFLWRKKIGLTWTHPAKFMRKGFIGHNGGGFPELILKVPLLLWGPGQVPVGSSDTQVRQVDIMPTLLDLAGVAPPEGIMGRTLLPLARGASEPHRDAFFGDAGAPKLIKKSRIAGVRVDNRYKYLYAPFRRGFDPELYDLQADPRERRNLAKQRPDLCADLLGRIEAMKSQAASAAELSSETQKDLVAHLKALGYTD